MTRNFFTNVSNKHKFVLWATDRCGARYNFRTLSDFGAEFLNSEMVHLYSCEDGLEDYKIICLTRHPAARLVSHYHLVMDVWDLVREGKYNRIDFKDFLYDHINDVDTPYERIESVEGFLNECKSRCNWFREPDLYLRLDYIKEDYASLKDLVPTLDIDLQKVEFDDNSDYSSRHWGKTKIKDYYTSQMLNDLYNSQFFNKDYKKAGFSPELVQEF